jgi:hypothetical protein
MKTLRRKNIKPKKLKNKTKRRYKKYLGGGPKRNMKNLIILLFQLTHADISQNTELLDKISGALDTLNNDLENVDLIKEGIISLKNKPPNLINKEKYLLLTSIYQLLIRKYDDDNTSLLKKVEDCENKEFDRISPKSRKNIVSKPLHHIRFSSIKSQEGVEKQPKTEEFDI